MLNPFRTPAHRTFGVALPLCLTLLTLLTMLALAATRLAVANAQLTGAIVHGEAAFTMAALAISRTLAEVADDPSLLPAAGSHTLPPLSYPGGQSNRQLHWLGAASCSELAPLPGERLDYELRVTASAARNAQSHQRQRFYLCREPCAAAPCTGAITGPLRSHWYITRPDLP